jgi:hypothetical protein
MDLTVSGFQPLGAKWRCKTSATRLLPQSGFHDQAEGGSKKRHFKVGFTRNCML